MRWGNDSRGREMTPGDDFYPFLYQFQHLWAPTEASSLGFQEEEPGNGSVTPPEEPPGPPGHPTTATGHAGTTVTTWPRATTSPPWSGDLAVTPAGNQTRTSSGVPVRYWSPVLFVLLALLVLFVTYQKTKGKGIQDRAMSGSDSSDLGALVQPPVQDPIPKIPALQTDAVPQFPLQSHPEDAPWNSCLFSRGKGRIPRPPQAWTNPRPPSASQSHPKRRECQKKGNSWDKGAIPGIKGQFLG
ncbi:uncharacterized protein LOC116436398 isoform X1 [Corvus moneduloides]|uniref:uncharacterized protein LOC116436398 isoform X1 n=1 Tax=Corvus moneduloides TaxID=1196302 RepID=UPI00136396BC|nr:uncharacterized protein LOC116436398 isoform X1 [Corvus moneduloides]